MASFNEIQRGGLNAILHKTLDMKEGAPSPQLSGDVVPTLTLEHDRPEWKFLAGEHLCGGGVSLAGVSGQLGMVQIYNPANSGTLIVVEKSMACTWNTREYWFGHTSSTYASQAAGAFRDSRLSRGSIVSVGQVWYQTNAVAALVTTLFRLMSPAGVTLTLDVPVILTPGNGWGIVNNTANDQINAAFTWRERALEPSELR